MLIVMSMMFILVFIFAIRIRMCIMCVRAMMRVVALLRGGACVDGSGLGCIVDGRWVGCRGLGGGILVHLRVGLTNGDGRGAGLEMCRPLAVVGGRGGSAPVRWYVRLWH